MCCNIWRSGIHRWELKIRKVDLTRDQILHKIKITFDSLDMLLWLHENKTSLGEILWYLKRACATRVLTLCCKNLRCVKKLLTRVLLLLFYDLCPFISYHFQLQRCPAILEDVKVFRWKLKVCNDCHLLSKYWTTYSYYLLAILHLNSFISLLCDFLDHVIRI